MSEGFGQSERDLEDRFEGAIVQGRTQIVIKSCHPAAIGGRAEALFRGFAIQGVHQ